MLVHVRVHVYQHEHEHEHEHGNAHMNDETGRSDPESLRLLLHLRALPGIGDVRLRALLDQYGSVRAAFAAPAAVLGERAAQARTARPVLDRVERALETIELLGVDVVTAADPRYPPGLRQLHDPPFVVFARGRLELLERPAVAVVGARRATTYGADAARALAGGLARAGVGVVSGLARGIDGAAHEAALAGGTIAVLGCGIDVVYPAAHAALHERVAAEGLLLSEFLPGEPAMRHNFPRRNRLIAALSLGVVVVEASARSGALITVEHALDLGREVFAVPGPIGRETSEGANALIRDGATLVMGVQDILEALRLPGPRASQVPGPLPATPPELSGDRLALWNALSEEPRSIDEVVAAAAVAPAPALAGLLELELAGHVRQLAGKRFVRG